MKILKLELTGLPHFKNVLDINFIAQQRVHEDDKEKLFRIFPGIYTNEAISFIGINASGKTTILKAISFAMSLLNNEAINGIETRNIIKDLGQNQEVIVTVYFYIDSFVYKLETTIRKKINEVEAEEKYIIADEKLWSKDIKRIKTKKNLFEFGERDLKIERDLKEQYLPEDVSIMIAENKINNSNFFVRDMSFWTNHNMLSVLAKFPGELLTFLDPSIEYLTGAKKDNGADIELKFYGKEKILINNPINLEKYLSSGTIKGLSVFMNALIAFGTGGYLIVDEIENHFNEEIVATLVRFFMDAKVNKKGATLIFSTHYSELLNEFDRNDSIYIVRNKNGINAENLANILKRNDIKKSEAYESGFLEGTVPTYEAYLALKKVLVNMTMQEV